MHDVACEFACAAKLAPTVAAKRAPPNKRFNEQNNCCARAREERGIYHQHVRYKSLYISKFKRLVSSAYFEGRELRRVIFRIFMWNWTLTLYI